MDKICTSIEQSQKLVELGIDVNTADMHYSTWTILNDGEYILSPNQGQTIEELQKDYGNQVIPAWSLTALLKLIKSEIYNKTIQGEPVTYKVDFRKFKFTDDIDLYQIAYGSIKFDVDGQYSFRDMINTGQKEEPIDAAFQMVCWLKENNKI